MTGRRENCLAVCSAISGAKQASSKKRCGSPRAEPLELADALYESLDAPADLGAEPAWVRELQRRLQKIDVVSATFRPWPVTRRQIGGGDADSAAG